MQRPTRRTLLAASLAPPTRRALFRGTFLQPWARHLEWSAAQWETLLDALASLACQEIVLQWCRYDDVDFAPLVPSLLDAARRRRMRLLVGLPYQSDWWRRIEEDAPQALGRIVARARSFASSSSARQWARHPAFGGWYLPEEIDDDHWLPAPRRRALAGALDQLAGAVHPLSASGFTNRASSPHELAEFWREMAARRRLARVFFQDGIGAGKMTLAAWPAYLEALRARLGKRLDVVVEIFESVPSDAGFHAVPAPYERVVAQADMARRALGRPPFCFSLPDYASPTAGPDAARLFEQLARR
ncbi:MAG: DUF4434 domain-containing protein [Bryobacteraceae bacterium]|jgi:hypothetical protein